MAFATSNVTMDNSGTYSVVRGTWTATVGDAAGTIQVAGIAIDADFNVNASSGAFQPVVPLSGLGSNTVTVYHLGTVTAGTFRVIYK